MTAQQPDTRPDDALRRDLADVLAELVTSGMLEALLPDGMTLDEVRSGVERIADDLLPVIAAHEAQVRAERDKAVGLIEAIQWVLEDLT